MESTKPYDLGLKQLFLHPNMVEALLKGFLSKDMVKDIDFTSLDTLNVDHTSDDLRTRENDIIWKIRAKNQWFYLVLLLELQSSVDRFMAVRVLTYSGLIYQDLLRNKKQNLIKRKLPPILALVFYTGDKPWRAPLTLRDCLSGEIPEKLMKYQAQMEYLILDVGRLTPKDYTLSNKSLLAALIELEKARNVADAGKAIDHAVKCLKGKVDSLKRAFYVYATRVLKLPERFSTLEIDNLCGGDMLVDRVEKWYQELREEGRQEGRQEEREEIFRTLAKVWEKKFTTNIPIEIKQKLETASGKELETLLDQILDETFENA